MALFKNSTRSLIVGGLFFLLPFVLVSILIGKAILILLPVGRSISQALGLHTVFGKASVLIVCVLLILLICLISGYFIKRGIFKTWSRHMEEQLFLYFPSLQVFKFRVFGDEKTVIQEFWDAILIHEDSHYIIGFITEKNGELFTIYIPDAPKLDAGEIRYIYQKDLTYYQITMKEAMSAIYNFGKGLPVQAIIQRNS